MEIERHSHQAGDTTVPQKLHSCSIRMVGRQQERAASFSLAAQVMAERNGYMVAAAAELSRFRGRGETFARAQPNEWGNGDYKDDP